MYYIDHVTASKVMLHIIYTIEALDSAYIMLILNDEKVESNSSLQFFTANNSYSFKS